jgi:hypothetical protein
MLLLSLMFRNLLNIFLLELILVFLLLARIPETILVAGLLTGLQRQVNLPRDRVRQQGRQVILSRLAGRVQSTVRVRPTRPSRPDLLWP